MGFACETESTQAAGTPCAFGSVVEGPNAGETQGEMPSTSVGSALGVQATAKVMSYGGK